MGPGKHQFWVPVGRLSAAFGAVVVALNILLNALAPSGRSSTEPQPEYDFLAHKKRQLQRNWRTIQRLFEGPSREEPHRSAPRFHPDWLVPPSVIVLSDLSVPPGEDAALPDIRPFKPDLPVTLAEVEPPKEDWSLTLRPRSENGFEGPLLTPEIVAEINRRCARTPWADLGDALLRGPEMLVDAVAALAGSLVRRRGDFDWHEGDRESVTSRILDIQAAPRDGRLVTDFMTNLGTREQRFLANFRESDATTPGFEDGSAGLSPNRLWSEERKVLWDALKNTYMAKYKAHSEDRIRDDAFYLSDWKGWDFAVLPPLLGGFLFYRGWEKKVSAGDLWLRIGIEPIREWVLGKHDLYAGVSVEWGIKGIPVGVIVSAGKYDGARKLDFVGIGTSVGVLRKVLALGRGD